jgi:hypothetical protein
MRQAALLAAMIFLETQKFFSAIGHISSQQPTNGIRSNAASSRKLAPGQIPWSSWLQLAPLHIRVSLCWFLSFVASPRIFIGLIIRYSSDLT